MCSIVECVGGIVPAASILREGERERGREGERERERCVLYIYRTIIIYWHLLTTNCVSVHPISTGMMPRPLDNVKLPSIGNTACSHLVEDRGEVDMEWVWSMWRSYHTPKASTTPERIMDSSTDTASGRGTCEACNRGN